VVDDVSFLGSIVRIRTHLGTEVLSMDLFNDPNQKLPARGDTVSLSFAFENLLVLA
jgi:putative spermidine/putrescine transport system ATP-binding protein